MIVHLTGRDTRHALEWYDTDGDPITPAELDADVTDADGDPVGDVIAATIDGDVIRLHIADSDDTAPGLYSYTVRARTDGGDWQYVDAGLLRVRNP